MLTSNYSEPEYSDNHQNGKETEWAITTTSNNGCTKTMICKQKSAQKTDLQDSKNHSALADTLIMEHGENSESLNKNHKQLEWNCNLCSEYVATRNSLTTHMKQHCKPFCIYCLRVVNSEKNLHVHKKKVHNIKMADIKRHTSVMVTSKYGRQRLVYNAATLLFDE